VCAVSRLPQLASPNLLLDGDECYVGLLARHVAQGREFPIFFYGQHYGLATVEASLGALAFAVFGSRAIVLKIAILALWTIGVAFLFLAAAHVLRPRRAFWATLVLVLMPAWLEASMKAWAGYVTAFTASAALVWLAGRSQTDKRALYAVLSGCIGAVIYLAQPLWLPGVFVIVLSIAISRRTVARTAVSAFVAAAVVVAVKLVPDPGVIWVGPAMGNGELATSLGVLADQIHVNLTGSYYLWWPLDPPGAATRALGWIWYAALPIMAVVQAWRLTTRRFNWASHVVFLSLSATLAAVWLLMDDRSGRYMLPLPALLVALASVEMTNLLDTGILARPATNAALAIVLVLGGASAVEFRSHSFLWPNPPGSLSEARRLREVISDLKVHGVTRVYSLNGLLDPQIIFYSNEEIIARNPAPAARYPAYLRQVDRALAGNEPVGVIGYTDDSHAPGCDHLSVCTGGIIGLVPNPASIDTIDHKYFVYAPAERDVMRALHLPLP
jgi:hypothetical protein